MGCHQPARMNEMEEEFPLLHDIRMSYLTSGGRQDDWDDLVHGLHHPQWAMDWMDSSSPSHAKRLDDLGARSLAAGNLIEYEIRDLESGTTSGVAVAAIEAFRVSRGQVSLEVRHLCTTDDQYEVWANYHINEANEFHLHLCKKPVGGCQLTPGSKKIGWVHVSRFRMTTYVKCLSPEYNSDQILDCLRVKVENLIGAFEADEPRVDLRPRGGDDFEDEESGEDVKRKRAALKSQSTPVVSHRVALGAAAPKSGDGKKKKSSGDLPVQRKETKRPEPAPGRGGKDDEGRRAQSSAVAATRALMGGHPQMVLVEARTKQGGDPAARPAQPWLDHLSTGDEGGDRPPSRSGHRERNLSGKPPGGGGSDDGDDDDDDEDRGRKGTRKDRSPSDDDKKRKSVKKRKRSRSDPGGDRNRGAGRASHIFPAGEKKRKKRKGGSGGDPDSSSSDDDKKRDEKKSRKDDKKKKKGHKKKKRKSRSSGTSSGTGSCSDSQAEFYGKDTSRYESLAEKARKKPGMLLKSGLTQMAKFLTIRTGGTDEEASRSWRDQRVGAYLNQVLFTQHSQEKLGLRNVRELVTLAEAIDLLMEGQFAAVGDVLMQRMKAVESSVTDGWQLASHQELIPPAKASLSTNLERSFVARQALQSRKLEESIRPKKG